jgi:hypothetical protein
MAKVILLMKLRSANQRSSFVCFVTPHSQSPHHGPGEPLSVIFSNEKKRQEVRCLVQARVLSGRLKFCLFLRAVLPARHPRQSTPRGATVGVHRRSYLTLLHHVPAREQAWTRLVLNVGDQELKFTGYEEVLGRVFDAAKLPDGYPIENIPDYGNHLSFNRR